MYSTLQQVHFQNLILCISNRLKLMRWVYNMRIEKSSNMIVWSIHVISLETLRILHKYYFANTWSWRAWNSSPRVVTSVRRAVTSVRIAVIVISSRWIAASRGCSWLKQEDYQVSQLPEHKIYSYARGFRAHWVSAHSNLERLATDSIGFSVLEMALI